MNTTINSTAISLQTTDNFSIQVTFTGTPTGMFKLQASNDPYSTYQQAPTNWTDIESTQQTVAAAGSVMWNYSQAGFNYVRCVYTDGSSGASTATITAASFNGKE